MNETLSRFIALYKDVYELHHNAPNATVKRKRSDELAIIDRVAKMMLSTDEYNQFVNDAN